MFEIYNENFNGDDGERPSLCQSANTDGMLSDSLTARQTDSQTDSQREWGIGNWQLTQGTVRLSWRPGRRAGCLQRAHSEYPFRLFQCASLMGVHDKWRQIRQCQNQTVTNSAVTATPAMAEPAALAAPVRNVA